MDDGQGEGGVTFAPEQLAWLNLIRDHIATSLSIEPGDFDYSRSASKAVSAAPHNSSATG